MTKVITGAYATIETARNVVDELINAGFDREKVFRAEDSATVKVMTPNDTEREAREILERHGPTEVFDRPA